MRNCCLSPAQYYHWYHLPTNSPLHPKSIHLNLVCSTRARPSGRYHTAATSTTLKWSAACCSSGRIARRSVSKIYNWSFESWHLQCQSNTPGVIELLSTSAILAAIPAVLGYISLTYTMLIGRPPLRLLRATPQPPWRKSVLLRNTLGYVFLLQMTPEPTKIYTRAMSPLSSGKIERLLDDSGP